MIIKKHKYLVIDNNASCKIFTSLRTTANHILVDHTTLSKKLKNNLDCICKAKKTKNLFYIKRL